MWTSRPSRRSVLAIGFAKGGAKLKLDEVAGKGWASEKTV
jgi:hypothetical protein